MSKMPIVTLRLHHGWRQHTQARIGLSRTGGSLVLRDHLAFQLAHAQARDAVHAQLDAADLAQRIEQVTHNEVLVLHSAAGDRTAYLCRPDLGRILHGASDRLKRGRYDLAIVVADGLSAVAAVRHAPPLLQQLLPLLIGWTLAPVAIVEQGRVVIGDPIGEAFGASIVLVLIGERPGLSSPDSLGAYLTWHPIPGRVDAARNCISNIRSEGLGYAEGAERLRRLLFAIREQKRSGVGLELGTELPLGTARLAPP